MLVIYAILILFLGIVFTWMFVYSMGKSYCYSLVEEEVEKELEKIQRKEDLEKKQTRHMYTEYGKKRNDKLF